jgi:hypothetical protein
MSLVIANPGSRFNGVETVLPLTPIWAAHRVRGHERENQNHDDKRAPLGFGERARVKRRLIARSEAPPEKVWGFFVV